MVNTEKYYKEVKELKNIKTGNFDKLYKMANCEIISKDDKDEIDEIELTSEILEDIFRVGVFPDLLIPLKFWDTEIGKAILQVRYKLDDVYIVGDVAELTNSSVQNVRKLASLGSIKGEKRGSTWLFKTRDIKAYLRRKSKAKYDTIEENIISDDVKEVNYNIKNK